MAKDIILYSLLSLFVVHVHYTVARSTDLTRIPAVASNLTDEAIFVLLKSGGRRRGGGSGSHLQENDYQSSRPGSSGGNMYGDYSDFERCPQYQEVRLHDLLPNSCISKYWIVHSGQEGTRKNIYAVKDFPRQDKLGLADYIQPRKFEETIDTMILIPVFQSNDNSLGLILEEWKFLQQSVNYIIAKNVAFKWIDPFFASPKPPVKEKLQWKSISVLITIESADRTISTGQMRLLREILQLSTPSSIFNAHLKYLTSVTEYNRRGHEEIDISNLELARRELCLESYPNYLVPGSHPHKPQHPQNQLDHHREEDGDEE